MKIPYYRYEFTQGGRTLELYCVDSHEAPSIHSLFRIVVTALRALQTSRNIKSLRRIAIRGTAWYAMLEGDIVKELVDYSRRLRRIELWIVRKVKDPEKIARLSPLLKPYEGLLYYDPLSAFRLLERGQEGYTRRILKELRASKLLRKLMECLHNSPWTSPLDELMSPHLTLLSSSKAYGIVEYGLNCQVCKSNGGKCCTVLDTYTVGPFIIDIIEEEDSKEKLYKVRLRKDIDELYKVAGLDIEHELRKGFLRKENIVNLKLSDLLNQIVYFVSRSLEGKVPSDLIDPLALYIAFRATGILSLAPFLLDDHVEEFYVDSPGTTIYLDHDVWGRCTSNVKVSLDDMLRFITHVRMDSLQDLNPFKPSLKADLITKYFRARVSVDAPPLSPEGPSLDVRKYRIKPFTLPELIRRRCISIEAAAFLLLCIRHRRNITITGEPDSGKTTLLNALDMCTPPHWRKVYVEDVVESIPQRHLGKHQLRLKVKTYEEEFKSRISSKSIEIVKLLHRSPDYVILGEIQSPEHTKALFSALSAGLRCIHTCHSRDVRGLLL
ncbi:MAG: hypothetical protein DRM97_03920, partial [Thermoprotei archaeon]